MVNFLHMDHKHGGGQCIAIVMNLLMSHVFLGNVSPNMNAHHHFNEESDTLRTNEAMGHHKLYSMLEYYC
jgi:hypothetical protein